MPDWTPPKEAESMVLLIDNYDSFTYNLAQYFGELGCDVLVKRNDEISIDEIASLGPQHICISPGPCTPREAGISKEVVLTFGQQIPVLGVCLGHQCIAEAYGGKVVRAGRLIHGKSSLIYHKSASILSGLPAPFEACRYHSLIVEADTFLSCLEVIAQTDGNDIMSIRQRA